jgi:hypothetical protein
MFGMAFNSGLLGCRISAANRDSGEKFFTQHILPLFAGELSSLSAADETTTEILIQKKLPFGDLKISLSQVPHGLIRQWAEGRVSLADFHQVPQRGFALDISVSATQSHYRPHILKEMRKNGVSFLKIEAFPELLHINFIVTGAVIKKQLPRFPGKGFLKDEALIESWLQCRFNVDGSELNTVFNSAVVGRFNLTPLFNMSVAPGLSRDFAGNPFLNIPFTLKLSEDRFNLTSVNMP